MKEHSIAFGCLLGAENNKNFYLYHCHLKFLPHRDGSYISSCFLTYSILCLLELFGISANKTYYDTYYDFCSLATYSNFRTYNKSLEGNGSTGYIFCIEQFSPLQLKYALFLNFMLANFSAKVQIFLVFPQQLKQFQPIYI